MKTMAHVKFYFVGDQIFGCKNIGAFSQRQTSKYEVNLFIKWKDFSSDKKQGLSSTGYGHNISFDFLVVSI